MSGVLDTVTDLLWEANVNRTRMPFVREFIADDDVDSAYEIQRRIVQRKIASGRTRAGRKVGLTNPLVQAKAGVNEPDYGTIMDDMVFHDGAVFDPKDYVKPKIEAEVAFALKKDLHAWDIPTIEDAIDFIAPAFELVDCHYENYGMKIVDTIADNAACAGIILGDRQPYGRVDLRDVRLSLTRDGVEITSGVGRNVMGNPINAIAWLARTACEQDVPLQAGELLLPGSIGLIMDFDFGPLYRADITGVGSVTARFAKE
ncbi:fumarylacetoacetate hydrolase family protein [Microbispora sp. NBRC 16548]|uniref:2-keto-4-pentenoate hydratase n=1 Tax=Microbispora sp. NBRC 16548 TaxID=3030994 RepID=UPI001607C005|nr:fumarylacetoacetate hydrolase family protein [Microbispora sp. NBRC 16548]GLX07986.1 2-keto-4-pentenoate hydratase [Microbispora sp. NBRC 16548]